jgi:signal transduction histidine kinase
VTTVSLVLAADQRRRPRSYREGVQALLRPLWDEPRPADPPARVWRDWVLVAVLVPATLLETLLRPDLPHRALAVVLTVGLVPTLLWRRTRPLLMVAIAFAASAGASVLTGGNPPEPATVVYVLLLPYALFRWGSGREIVLGSAIMLARMALTLATGELLAGEAAGGLAVLAATCALGGALRYRASARLRELDQVKLLERESLARDLHDTVAHHVSAIAIRAQAGIATSATRPDAAVEALAVIEAEATRTLAEMRSMVHVLRRAGQAELAPSPRIADLAGLADTGGTGPAVDVAFSGDVDDVPPSVAAAVYRLAQESVTNSRRHARNATRIEVRVAADESAVRLHVRDDGDGGAARAPGSGYGLVGMIERAELLGGTCEAGPGPGRGWTVTAALPRAGWAS